MAKGSRGGKRKGGSSSNAKYNGFSITDKNGNTSHYKVINGKVMPAVEGYGVSNFTKGFSKSPVQTAYEKYGSVNAIIKQVRKRGGKASILSDKAVEKMQSDYLKEHKESIKNIEVRSNKKGVNRHRTFWSAM